MFDISGGEVSRWVLGQDSGPFYKEMLLSPSVSVLGHRCQSAFTGDL